MMLICTEKLNLINLCDCLFSKLKIHETNLPSIHPYSHELDTSFSIGKTLSLLPELSFNTNSNQDFINKLTCFTTDANLNENLQKWILLVQNYHNKHDKSYRSLMSLIDPDLSQTQIYIECDKQFLSKLYKILNNHSSDVKSANFKKIEDLWNDFNVKYYNNLSLLKNCDGMELHVAVNSIKGWNMPYIFMALDKTNDELNELFINFFMESIVEIKQCFWSDTNIKEHYEKAFNLIYDWLTILSFFSVRDIRPLLATMENEFKEVYNHNKSIDNCYLDLHNSILL